jgi:hypothetical protein
MKNRLATLSFLFLFSAAYSQDGFVNGYIVRNSRDTLRGLIQTGVMKNSYNIPI